MNVQALQDIASEHLSRFGSAWDELDWALGRKNDYGIPRGKISLWAGSPGIGKTRIIVQLMKSLDVNGLKCLLFQGEQSPASFKDEKMKGYVPYTGIWISEETAIDEQIKIKIIEQLKPDLVITDSVQQVEEYEGGRGAKMIVSKLHKALEYGGHVIFISQLTQAGKTAGGNKLPHFVDVECKITKATALSDSLILLTVGKNRCGKSGGMVVFAHRDWGSTGSEYLQVERS